MKTSNISRFCILAPIALSMAACVGGGGGGDSYVAVSPIQGVTMADIEDRTSITDGEAMDVDNAVAIINNIEGYANARLVIRSSAEGEDDDGVDPAIYIQIDQDGDGVYDSEDDWTSTELSLNPDGNPISAITGEPLVISELLTLGDSDAVIAEYIPDYRSRTTVYVPADSASDMYGGMYVYSRDGGDYFSDAQGAVVTWGSNITSDEFSEVMSTELNSQDGRATYSGVAEAIVSGAASTESGRYRDYDATGEINFATNTVTTSADLTGIDNTDSSMSVSTSMTFNSDGTINTGTSTATGLSVGTVSGSATGEIYGPDADTLGVVFTGTDGDEAQIIGGMLLNRTDD
jgi:hypothetical protein